MKHFAAQETKVSPSNHRSFELFHTIDGALHDSVTPGQGKNRRHGCIIARDAQGKALEFRNLRGFGPLEPVGKLLPLTLLQHPPELLSQRRGEFQVLMLAELLKMVKGRRCHFLARSQQKSGRPARRKTALARRRASTALTWLAWFALASFAGSRLGLGFGEHLCPPFGTQAPDY